MTARTPAQFQVVDFGPGPIDQTTDFPFAGSEAACHAWMDAHQVWTTVDGVPRYRYGLIEALDEDAALGPIGPIGGGE